MGWLIMVRTKIGIAFVTAAAVVTLSAAALAANEVVGIAAAVLNQVRVQPAGTAQAHPLLLRQRVALGDQIQTGERGQAQLMLLDKSTFTIGANARLTIDRFVYDPHSRSLTATVAKGAFRFMSGRPDRAGDASIGTPVSTIGIRGTIVEGVIGSEAVAIAGREPALNSRLTSDPETASLIVLRGPGSGNKVHAAPGSITVTAGNQTVSLDRPMLAAYVPAPGAAPIGPFTLSADGLRRLEGLVFASLAEQLRSATTSGSGYKPITPYSGSTKPPWAQQGPGGPWVGGPLGQPPGGGAGSGPYLPAGGLGSGGLGPSSQPSVVAAPAQGPQPKKIAAPAKNQSQVKGGVNPGP
jgi:hypothetical protein